MKSYADASLLDPDTIRSPFDYYSWMRAEDPVHFDATARAYLVTRFEDIQQAVRLTETLSSEKGLTDVHREPWQDEIDEMMRREGYGPHSTADNFNVDPPLHARRRALVDKAFTAQSVARMEDDVSRIVRELMDVFIDRGHADMVSEFAIPISIYVISDQMGLPRDRLDDYKRWSDSAVVPIGRGVGKEQSIKYARDMMEMHHFLMQHIEDRRKNPGTDLISGLVHARLDGTGEQLNQQELLSGSVALLAAGNETTRNGMSWEAYLLAREPGLLMSLRDAPDQNRALQRFVEEALRIQPPVPQLPRVALEDVVIGGVKVPKGSFVYLCWASGNRDAAKFENADKFDLERKNVGQHLTFGAGIHRCVGAMLARMEMKCCAREIVNRLDNYKLGFTGEPETWGTFVFRGPRTLPATFTKRAV